MKKVLFTVALTTYTFYVNAQIPLTVDFESFNLETESYYNGSDELGGFTIQNVHFSTEYNSNWGSWNGFSVSNITDKCNTRI
jgi:hypothetical protein